MENHQPKAQKIASLGEELEQFQGKDSEMEEWGCELSDSHLCYLIGNEVPPFVVTKNYKIRRESSCPEPESDPEAGNIQDKILSYNRKDKSLMELTRKFIQKFEGASSNILVLDQVTCQLNVERRRIYDIINIMESLAVVCKIRKNVYEWKGLRKAVETIGQFGKGGGGKVWGEEVERNRKEKSLESLATQFLKLFSQSKQYLTLEQAAQIILCEANEHVKKTKIRRLYDIINVFKCLGLVQKVKTPKELGNKPTYQWLGCKKLQKLIEQKQSQARHTDQPQHSLTSSDTTNKKQNTSTKLRKFTKSTKTTKISYSGNDEPFKDISNMDGPMVKRSRRNSDSACKDGRGLEKKASFTSTRLAVILGENRLQGGISGYECEDIVTPITKLALEPWPIQMAEMQDISCQNSPSFFCSLVKKYTTPNNLSISMESINNFHNVLRQSIWPS